MRVRVQRATACETSGGKLAHSVVERRRNAVVCELQANGATVGAGGKAEGDGGHAGPTFSLAGTMWGGGSLSAVQGGLSAMDSHGSGGQVCSASVLGWRGRLSGGHGCTQARGAVGASSAWAAACRQSHAPVTVCGGRAANGVGGAAACGWPDGMAACGRRR